MGKKNRNKNKRPPAPPPPPKPKIPLKKRMVSNCMVAVLKYMTPNIRFRISQAVPLMRREEYEAPLHMNRFVCEPAQMMINNTVYKIDRISSISYFDKDDKVGEPSNYLEFRTTSRRRCALERLLTDQTIEEAMIYLTGVFFSWRQGPVHVKCFGVIGNASYLPGDITFKTKCLQLPHSGLEKAIESITTSIDESSFPLDTVVITEARRDHEIMPYHHQWIKEAGYLQILDRQKVVNWLPTMMALTNKEIHLQSWTFLKDECAGLIEDFMEMGRDPGTSISIAMTEETDVKELLQELKQLPGVVRDDKIPEMACAKFPRITFLPIQESENKVMVYVTENECAEQKNKQVYFSKWDVHIAIVKPNEPNQD
uniref:PAZ domain-containing protein n=2 Tax=Caenorhabditis tropicalis TaxID=1561998 RepID=A0A1I7UGL4_9PELO